MADTGSFVPTTIPKFDGYYEHWAMLMENFLRSRECWDLIETGLVTQEAEAKKFSAVVAEKPQNAEAQRKLLLERKLKDLKVKNFLFQALDRQILETILNKDTSKDIWDSMKRKYEGNARVKRSVLQALRKEFEVLEMKTGETVNEYFSRVISVANRMRSYGQKMDDVVVVEKIFRSLTERFNYIVCSIEESRDIDKMSIDELQSSLIVHEQKFRRHNSEEQALKATHEERSSE